MIVDVARDDLRCWVDGPDPVPVTPLRGDTRARVAVVGGGFTGLSAAYHLVTARPDLDVVLLESHVVGAGASGRNTGILRPGVGGTVLDLVRRHGEDTARRLYEASLAAVDRVAALVALERLDCDLEPVPHLKLAVTDRQADLLEREAAVMERLGLDARLLPAGDAAAMAPVPSVAGLLYPQGGQLNPARLCRELARVLLARGVRVHARTPVRAVLPGRPVRVVTDTGTVLADDVLLATNGYTAGLGFLRGRVLPLQTHVGVTAPVPTSLLAALRWAGGCSFSDKRHVFDYHRLTRDGRVVFGGGRPLYRPAPGRPAAGRPDIADTGVWAAQRAAFRARFPELADVPVSRQWSGTMGMTLDRFPIVGRPAPGVLFAGGWSGHGVALAAASGALVADVLLGRPNPDAELPWMRSGAPWLPPDPLRALGLAGYVAGLRLADRVDARRPARRRAAAAVPTRTAR